MALEWGNSAFELAMEIKLTLSPKYSTFAGKYDVRNSVYRIGLRRNGKLAPPCMPTPTMMPARLIARAHGKMPARPRIDEVIEVLDAFVDPANGVVAGTPDDHRCIVDAIGDTVRFFERAEVGHAFTLPDPGMAFL